MKDTRELKDLVPIGDRGLLLLRAQRAELDGQLVRRFAERVRARARTVRADGLQILRGIEEDLRQIDRWTDVAARALASGRRRNRLPRPGHL